MAGGADCRRILVALVGVAALAGRFAMFSSQGEFCLAVVETGWAPTPIVMAVGTGLAHSAFVGLVAAMTADALPGRVAKLLRRFMTVPAAESSMGAAEGKVCGGVVEIFPVEADNIGFPAFVVGMAMLAFDGAN